MIYKLQKLHTLVNELQYGHNPSEMYGNLVNPFNNDRNVCIIMSGFSNSPSNRARIRKFNAIVWNMDFIPGLVRFLCFYFLLFLLFPWGHLPTMVKCDGAWQPQARHVPCFLMFLIIAEKFHMWCNATRLPTTGNFMIIYFQNTYINISC